MFPFGGPHLDQKTLVQWKWSTRRKDTFEIWLTPCRNGSIAQSENPLRGRKSLASIRQDSTHLVHNPGVSSNWGHSKNFRYLVDSLSSTIPYDPYVWDIPNWWNDLEQFAGWQSFCQPCGGIHDSPVGAACTRLPWQLWLVKDSLATWFGKWQEVAPVSGNETAIFLFKWSGQEFRLASGQGLSCL